MTLDMQSHAVSIDYRAKQSRAGGLLLAGSSSSCRAALGRKRPSKMHARSMQLASRTSSFLKPLGTDGQIKAQRPGHV